jgi:hypothetical protein
MSHLDECINDTYNQIIKAAADLEIKLHWQETQSELWQRLSEKLNQYSAHELSCTWHTKQICICGLQELKDQLERNK